MQRLRRLFARTRLEKEEVNILRGFLGACEKGIQAPDASPLNNSSARLERSEEGAYKPFK